MKRGGVAAVGAVAFVAGLVVGLAAAGRPAATAEPAVTGGPTATAAVARPDGFPGDPRPAAVTRLARDGDVVWAADPGGRPAAATVRVRVPIDGRTWEVSAVILPPE
jgi:hypothetical protein